MNNNGKKTKPHLPTQSMLSIRAVVGVYLIYLAYDIANTEAMTVSRIGIILFCILFVIAGIVLVIMTIRSFIRGEYVGGKADFTEEEHEEEDNQLIIDDDTGDNSSERM